MAAIPKETEQCFLDIEKKILACLGGHFRKSKLSYIKPIALEGETEDKATIYDGFVISCEEHGLLVTTVLSARFCKYMNQRAVARYAELVRHSHDTGVSKRSVREVSNGLPFSLQ